MPISTLTDVLSVQAGISRMAHLPRRPLPAKFDFFLISELQQATGLLLQDHLDLTRSRKEELAALVHATVGKAFRRSFSQVMASGMV